MKRFAISTAVLATLFGASHGELVYVNSHSPWMTMRNDSVVAKLQIDSVALANKKIKVDASLVQSGRKRNLGSKTVTVNSSSHDFLLGTVGSNLLGGRDFVSISWTVLDTTEKGNIAPLGVVSLERLPSSDTVKSRMVRLGGDVSKASSGVRPDDFVKVGDFEVAVLWDSSALYIVSSKPQSGGSLTAVVDGKNAKSAFVAYADRFITYWPTQDSVSMVRYNREFRNDSLLYTTADWRNESRKGISGNYFVIALPWHDMGMIPPFAGRQVGFSLFAAGRDGKASTAFPSTSRRDLPGSWGNLKFVQ